MASTSLFANVATGTQVLDMPAVAREFLHFEEDYELANDEYEVRRAIQRNGMIGTESLGLDLA